MVRKVATPARSSVVTLDPAPARPKKRSSGAPFPDAWPGAPAAFCPALPLFCFAVPTAAIFPLARFRNYGMLRGAGNGDFAILHICRALLKGFTNDCRPIPTRSAHAVGPRDDRPR